MDHSREVPNQEVIPTWLDPSAETEKVDGQFQELEKLCFRWPPAGQARPPVAAVRPHVYYIKLTRLIATKVSPGNLAVLQR